MPLTRQCKANFIPLMLINKLLSEKSMHFSPLNVCDKFLIRLKMKEMQKHWLLRGDCGQVPQHWCYSSDGTQEGFAAA